MSQKVVVVCCLCALAAGNIGLGAVKICHMQILIQSSGKAQRTALIMILVSGSNVDKGLRQGFHGTTTHPSYEEFT